MGKGGNKVPRRKWAQQDIFYLCISLSIVWEDVPSLRIIFGPFVEVL